MPVQSSRFYNSPQLGQVFNNLSSMFGPPDSGELVNYAQAADLRQKNDIIENLKSDPRYQGADGGVLAGLFNPTQSWQALDMGDATTRRGQDISASTSRANNRENNQFGTIGDLYGPLNPGQVRPELPGPLTDFMGLPAIPGVAGTEKPLSTDELNALTRQRLLLEGDLTDDDFAAEFLGQVPIENVVGENGPEIVRRPDAVGREPHFNKGAEAKPDLYSYTTPDGARGTAILTEQGLIDTQSQQLLPEGTRAAKANVQGTAEEVGLAPTTANQTSANNQRAELTRALGLLDLYEGVIRDDPGAIGLAGSLQGVAQNAIAVTQDLASSFGTTAPELQEFSNDLRNGLQDVAPEMFNPNIPAAEFYQGALAYSLARTENPSGEVSRQAYERALGRVTGGALSNSQSAMSAVQSFRQMLNTQLEGIATLDDPSRARTDTNYNGGAEQPARPQTDEEYNALPSGAVFVDPEDGRTYRKP